VEDSSLQQLASRTVRRLSLAAILAALAIGAGAGPAAAYSTVETGLVGNYWYNNDSSGSPLAGCGYHDEGYTNWIWLDWVRVPAPIVYAADRNSENDLESRRVSFQLKIQRHLFGSTDPWKVVASSPIQVKRAYENTKAPFSAIKLYFTPDKTLTNGQRGQFRAMVVLKFIKNNGVVEGTVKLWPSFYNKRSPYGDGVEENYCSGVDTNG
jgi:hypothetical protein